MNRFQTTKCAGTGAHCRSIGRATAEGFGRGEGQAESSRHPAPATSRAAEKPDRRASERKKEAKGLFVPADSPRDAHRATGLDAA